MVPDCRGFFPLDSVVVGFCFPLASAPSTPLMSGTSLLIRFFFLFPPVFSTEIVSDAVSDAVFSDPDG